MPIEYAKEPFKDEESLGVLNKYVRNWFTRSFKELTPPQKYSFKLISDRKNVLITAPTGSGKTMSGFVTIISKLFDHSLEGTLEQRVYCIYVSPLRALNNDVYKNLQAPLEAIYKLIARDKGMKMLKENIKQVTVGIRTGDTTTKERADMLKHPPHILVTTPESLAILLNSSKFAEHLKSVEYVIVDEIHELANNKRGVHLSLSIERLYDMTKSNFARVGLGATLYPLDEAAKFLVGYTKNGPNDCIIVDASWSKELDVMTVSPVRDMIYASEREVDENTYNELNSIIKAGKTTLIFTNTRSGTERVVFNLKRKFGYTDEDVAAHHGSLSKESRLEVEDLLKKGSLKCVVSSTSLELGVDVGAIDTVVQLGSPKSVTRAVQRIGRAGHSFKSVAKGRMIVLNRDDLVECAIMLDAALKKRLDSFTVPQNALDVLAQHIVGMSLTRKWDVEEAYDTIRRVYAYHALEKGDFLSLLDYLGGKHTTLESQRVYGKILYDEKGKTFESRGQFARVIYMTNIGTIPDSVSVMVVQVSPKKLIGSIEEEFLTHLKPGDIFTLGGRLYQYEYAKDMVAYVHLAQAASPTIPPWFSEQLPLSYELASEIGAFRAEFSKVMAEYVSGSSAEGIIGVKEMPKEIVGFLSKLPADPNSKEAIFRYFLEQILYAGCVPSRDLLLIESTHDPGGDKHYLIFHSLFGRRVNDALSRAIGIKVADCLDESIGLQVSDNGFMLIFDSEPNIKEKKIMDIMTGLSGKGISQLLKANIRHTEMMHRRFRQVAARSFMILRNYKGWNIGVDKQQASALGMLKSVEKIDPNFPVLKETYREIFNDVMDLPRAEAVLSRIGSGELKCQYIVTEVPSPFAHSMSTFGHTDVIMMHDRRLYMQKLHELVLKRISQKK